MNHRRIQRLLSPYLDEELPEEERSEVAAHLQSCQACLNQLEELQTVGRAIRAVADVDVPDDFSHAVLRAARQECENSLLWLGPERFARDIVIALSAAVICLIGVGSLLKQEPLPRIDRYLIVEASDSLTQRVFESQDEISKDDVVFAALTK